MTVTALPAGTILYCGKTEYRILELVSRGGSSFVYQVEQEGQPASALLVKEACPNDEKLALERRGVSIVAHDAAAGEALDACRRMLRSEQDLGAHIKRFTRRVETLYTLLKLDKAKLPGKDLAVPCKEGAFALLPDIREQGVFLKDFRSDHRLQLPEIARMLERAVYPVAAMHSIGIVHGDISQNNIFFVWDVLDRSRTAEAVLIDFGCAKRVNADGKTERLDDVLSTQRFAAPELYGENVQLDLSSDVFSLGCVFLLLLSRLPAENADPALDLRAKKQLRDLVTSDMLRARGGRPEAVRLAKKILRCALDPLPASASDSRRYPNAVKMLKDVQRLTALAQTPACALLNTNLTTTPYWVEGSRDTVLDRLDQELQSGKHPLVLFGDGGSGKTETAIAFGIRQRDRQDDLAREVFFVHYQESMLRTILSLEFSNYSGVPEGTPDRERAEFRERLQIIRNAYENALFIFDNFDSETEQYADLVEEPAFQAVGKLPIKILLTTRFRPDNITPELEQMQVADLVTLFCSAAGMERQPEDGSQMREDIVALILQVERHPLTVELLGAAIAESDSTLTVAMLRQKMERGDAFDDAGLPEVPAQRVHGDWRSAREQRIYAHLKQVFDVSEMNEQQKTVLCCAALLGPAGMDEALFKTCCGSGNAYKRLKKRCWLKVKGGTVTIHPLIREVALRELAPCLEICKPFLDGLWNEYDQREWGKKWDPKQMLPVFVNAHRLFSQNDLHADNAYRAAHIMYTCIERCREAQVLAEYAAAKRESIGNLAGAADAYRCAGRLLCVSQQRESAIISALHAYEIDCFKRKTINLGDLCDDFNLLHAASEPGSAAAENAGKAELLISAVALYRAMPGLESHLRTENRLDSFFVDPDDDSIVLPLLLDASCFSSEMKFVNDLLSKYAMHEVNAMQAHAAKEKRCSFSLRSMNTCVHILEYLSDHVDEIRESASVETIDQFLNAIINFEWPILEHRGPEFVAKTVEIRQGLFPDRSRATELANIGIEWSSLAFNPIFEGDRMEALRRSRSYALQGLCEAEEKAPEERAHPLAVLAAVSLDLWEQMRAQATDAADLEEAERQKEEAVQYAFRAIDAYRELPGEPVGFKVLRTRFFEIGIQLPERSDPAETDEDTIKGLFDNDNAGLDWYFMRETERKVHEKKKALQNYQSALTGWYMKEHEPSPPDAVWKIYSDLEKLDDEPGGEAWEKRKEDFEWVSAQEARLRSQPDAEDLLPYHIDRCVGKTIQTNRIRCRKCDDDLISADDYAAHRIRICSCGRCGIDGGAYALIRFSRAPDADDYEELSKTEPIWWNPA